MRRMIPVLAIFLAVAPALAQAPVSPYAGQQHRAIKALSAEEMRDLAEGRGMGLAKAAELNGFPGPLHVLELAGELHLTPAQRAATEALFQRMLAEAKRLGASILEAEADLERRFAERRIDRARLQAATAALAALQGELRVVHLAAHLDQVVLLTADQVTTYNARRGYAEHGPGHFPKHN
jgi:Spy/CpxP family protein refolding chaperone